MLETTEGLTGLLGLPLGLEVTVEGDGGGGGAISSSTSGSSSKIAKRLANPLGLLVLETNGLGVGELENGLCLGDGVVFSTEKGDASEVNWIAGGLEEKP